MKGEWGEKVEQLTSKLSSLETCLDSKANKQSVAAAFHKKANKSDVEREVATMVAAE